MVWSRRRIALVVALAAMTGLAGFCGAVSGTGVGRPTTQTGDLVIAGGWVVDAHSPAPRLVDVVVRSGRITELVPPGDYDAAEVEVVDASGRYVVPGLIDVHTHMLRAGLCAGDEGLAWTNFQQIALNFDVAAYAGTTTVVDLGGPLQGTVAVRDALNRPGSLAPRYLVAGPVVTNPGGYPLDWADPEMTRDYDVVVTVADESEARAQVQRIAQAGVDVIKLISMDVGYNGAQLSVMPTPVLRAAVDAAHEHGLRAFVHAHTNAGYEAALDAGADVIAHSTFEPMPDTLVQRVAEAPVVVVPTLWAFSAFEAVRADPSMIEQLRPQLMPPLYGKLEDYTARMLADDTELPPDFQPGIRWETVVGGNEAAHENLGRLADAGATIAFGTDTSYCFALHGDPIRELREMERSGLTAAEVFEAATVGSATALGRSDLGVVSVGAAADLLVVDTDPRGDLAGLQRPHTVVAAGRVVPPPTTPAARRTAKLAWTLARALL